MSHELRTPMNAILGFTEMLIDGLYGDMPADAQGAADRHPAQRPPPAAPDQRRARPFQDRGRTHAAGARRVLGARDRRHRAHVSLRSLAAEKGLEFTASVPDDLPVAYGDSGRLTQCLMNLAGNALKFTRAAAGSRSASSSSAADVVFRVTDTGIGIAPEELEQRVHGVPPGRHDGHARVRRHRTRAQHHQASSSRCTAAASGSRASSARAPRSFSRSRCGRREVTRHERAHDSLHRGQRVQPQDRASAARRSRPTGWSRRSTARRGVAMAQQQLPQLILMDVQLPKMSGLEATRLLKADPRTRAHPDHRDHVVRAERRPREGVRRPAPTATSPSRTARASCWRWSGSSCRNPESDAKEVTNDNDSSRTCACRCRGRWPAGRRGRCRAHRPRRTGRAVHAGVPQAPHDATTRSTRPRSSRPTVGASAANGSP